MLKSNRLWIPDRYLMDKRERDKYCLQSQKRVSTSKKMLLDIWGQCEAIDFSHNSLFIAHLFLLAHAASVSGTAVPRGPANLIAVEQP